MADGPPRLAAVGVATAADTLTARLTTACAKWGTAPSIDGPSLLGERAAIAGLVRNGSTSVGGSARFFEASDGWIALNLARPEDVASLPALVSADVASDDWTSLRRLIGAMSCDRLREQAVWLGLAVAQPNEHQPVDDPSVQTCVGGPRTVVRRPLVVDMSSLWGGPLSSNLLEAAGARVIKVEGCGRPDGSRRGPRPFFDLLNARKEMLETDFGDPVSVALLRSVLAHADLVIEGSRPRAMTALGIRPEEFVAAGTSWLSITGHGRAGVAGDRIGFGDDAAVAGGLVINDHVPVFVADAVADPLTGLAAAAVGAELLGSPQAAMVDVALARVSAWVCGRSTGPLNASVVSHGDDYQVALGDQRVDVAAPTARPVRGTAAPVGAHSRELAEEFDPASRGPYG